MKSVASVATGVVLAASFFLPTTSFAGAEKEKPKKEKAEEEKPKKPEPVIIVNTPLPVQGAVTIGGTPTVMIAPTGNGVEILNKTLDVRTADGPSAQTPYASGGHCGKSILDQCVVPAGKRLTIEYISGLFEGGPEPQNDVLMFVTEPGQSEAVFHTFVGNHIPGCPVPCPAGFGLFAFSTPFRALLDAGAIYYFLAGGDVERLNVSGYLIDQP